MARCGGICVLFGDLVLGDKAVIEHYLRMVIPDEGLVDEHSALPVEGVFIDLGDTVEFAVFFFFKAMPLLGDGVGIGERPFAAELALEDTVLAPDTELDILIGSVLESEVYVIIAD